MTSTSIAAKKPNVWMTGKGEVPEMMKAMKVVEEVTSIAFPYRVQQPRRVRH